MKIFVIASTEYEANMPDLFLMDAESNYYGVSQNSYASWHKFPKSIDHWMNAEGSDAGRFFNIDEVDIPTDQVEEFDRITKEYERLDAETPRFELTYPAQKDYKTKKAYQEACDDFETQHSEWCKTSGIQKYMSAKNELWEQRTRLFCSFSKKVRKAISDNNYIKQDIEIIDRLDAKLQDLYNRFEEYNLHQMEGEEVSFEDYVNGMTYEPGFFRWLFDDEDLLDYEIGDQKIWELFLMMVKRESVEPIRDRAIKEVKNWEDDYLTELLIRSYLNHSHEWIEIETDGTIHEAEEADNNTTHWIDYPNKEVANIYNIHMESAEACNTEVCILYRDFEKMDKESFIDRHSLEEWEYVNDTDFKEAVIDELHCNSVFEDDVREEIVENIRNIEIGYFDDEKN